MKPKPLDLAALSDEAFVALAARAVRELPDPPPALQRLALGAWVAPPPGLQARAEALWREVRAVLSFDSWAAAPVAAGMRSLRGSTRHLLFSAEGRDVDLRVSPGDQAYTLMGQVLGPDAGGTVELTSADDALQAVTLDDLGEFRVAGLAPGVYRLTLLLGSDRVVLPPFQVGEPTGGAAA